MGPSLVLCGQLGRQSLVHVSLCCVCLLNGIFQFNISEGSFNQVWLTILISLETQGEPCGLVQPSIWEVAYL